MMKRIRERKQRERTLMMKGDEVNGRVEKESDGDEDKEDSGDNGSHNESRAAAPARLTRLEYKTSMKVRCYRAYLSLCSYSWLAGLLSSC